MGFEAWSTWRSHTAKNVVIIALVFIILWMALASQQNMVRCFSVPQNVPDVEYRQPDATLERSRYQWKLGHAGSTMQIIDECSDEERSKHNKSWDMVMAKRLRTWRHGSKESERTISNPSGPGSSLAATRYVRQFLRQVFDDLNIHTFLDAPCGDMTWMPYVNLTGVDYYGGDISPSLVAHNTDLFGEDARFANKFQVFDITCMIPPKIDMIHTRDVFLHISSDLSLRALKNFERSGSGYVAITHWPDASGDTNEYHPTRSEKAYPEAFKVKASEAQVIGSHKYNLELPPYCLPPPLYSTQNLFGVPGSSVMGVWKLPALGRGTRPQCTKQTVASPAQLIDSYEVSVCRGQTCTASFSSGLFADFLQSPKLLGGPLQPCCTICGDVTTSACSNSRNEEQIFLSHVLPFVTYTMPDHPVFLEMGGYDGWHETNTHFLEQCLGWKGILIEANPRMFKRMKQLRPGTLNIRSAICREAGHVKFAGNHPGAHIATELDDSGYTVAPCRPLREFLSSLNVSRIDFFSLDVEGFELQVAESVDWSQFSAAFLVVEELSKHQQKNEQVRELLTQRAGMEILAQQCWKPTACDAYFVNPRFVDVAAAKKHLASVPLPKGFRPPDQCRPKL
ncbi:unnamed protein product [Symbiodinium natans]|uniref:Methyltransferase FkbM domain-containing protein n=1 Tax=Symbiodinium natans TaxID=878477 RepID=A0A812THK2_9DINO|nr:unnamed protein product [Symbiodinium natans]